MRNLHPNPLLLVLAVLVAGTVTGWLLLARSPLVGRIGNPSSDPPPLSPTPPSPVPIPAVRFIDITEAAGIHFQHSNGAFGKKLLPETMGSGVAFLDYDNDGHQDLLFIN